MTTEILLTSWVLQNAYHDTKPSQQWSDLVNDGKCRWDGKGTLYMEL